ncbi:hypothetical protein MRB53_040292 [Persea americana]|nr:hypothetical protein MRB53_040292 [Persea americana]
MRISIRVKLGSLLLVSSLIGLGVISIAVWVTVHSFVLDIQGSRLSLEALLKAAQLSSNIDLMQTSASFVTNRLLIQQALRRYNLYGNNSDANWASADVDFVTALSGSGSLGQSLLLQGMVVPANLSGPAGPYSVLNATISAPSAPIVLPYTYPNGSHVLLGANDTSLGYPPLLYPNASELTRSMSTGAEQYSSKLYRPASAPNETLPILSGPWMINSTYGLVSITNPVLNTTDASQLLGWMTIVMDASLIMQVSQATDGLYASGETLIVGPSSIRNKYPTDLTTNLTSPSTATIQARYIFPPNTTGTANATLADVYATGVPVNSMQLPVVKTALQATASSDYSGASLRGVTADGTAVSYGYALAKVLIVDWIVLVQSPRSEVWEPINNLRNTILACLFATAAFMIVISYPLAHFASLPILRLRHATSQSIEPPHFPDQRVSGSLQSMHDDTNDPEDDPVLLAARKEGLPLTIVRKLRRPRSDTVPRALSGEEEIRRGFRIPGKVQARKKWIPDELSDLEATFNAMTDELLAQYSKLEERVQQRTAELELSKKAAEAANESKTLFIANISHELKTPLNGILGMCAVCMQEDDPIRLKRSLGIIYKSGDLLLNLLTDLLTFSKNQVGQHLTLDEKQFRLRDISLQTMAIFEKQANEGKIDLRVEYEGYSGSVNDLFSPEGLPTKVAPNGPRIRDMIVWGDMHRILQVIINLTSNSLKFTPPGGSVILTIRCLQDGQELATKSGQLTSKAARRQTLARQPSDVSMPISNTGTAYSINPSVNRDRSSYVGATRESAAPLPSGSYHFFEFAVTDTGPGIPEELQTKIFEPFVQGDLGLSRKFGGTGLGLSICSQLAKLMQGSVSVRSAVGVGSTFTLRIPLRHIHTRADSAASSTFDVRVNEESRRGSFDESDRVIPRRNGSPGTSKAPSVAPSANSASESSPDTEQARPSAPTTRDMTTDPQPRLVGLSQPFFAASPPMESPGSQPAAMDKITAEAARSARIRVLVAEDNQVNQEVVLRMLKLEDIYDVTVAKDGQEALDFVKESMQSDADNPSCRPFDLIFMDVQMPNVDGLESTRLIREIGYRAPIVALTAFAEDSNIKDCLDSGMNYFLSKPIRRPQLKKVLKEYCPPIPEEREDPATPPVLNPSTSLPLTYDPESGDPDPGETSRSGSHHTIVVVNGHVVESSTSTSLLPLHSSPFPHHPYDQRSSPELRPALDVSPSRLQPPPFQFTSTRPTPATSRPSSPRSRG